MTQRGLGGLSIERQTSEFGLGDRQESVLEPGFVRPPRDMKPPTPVEWGRGDSLMWETTFPVDKSTPLAGYGREKDLFADAVAAVSPTQNNPAHFPPPPQQQQQQHQPPRSINFVAAPDHHHPSGPSDPLTDVFGRQNHHSVGPSIAGAPVAATVDQGAVTRQRTSEDLAMQFRTQSQQLTDELWRQSTTFAPPPPIIGPIDSRRPRAELWYYHATKWDITHSLAPPPRTPLPFMDEEKTNPARINEVRYPYRGEYWLGRCNWWFDHMVRCFPYPALMRPDRPTDVALDPKFILEHCVVATE